MEHRHLLLAYGFVFALQFGYAAFTWARWRVANQARPTRK
jgi:hypothetical protein